MKGSYLLPLAIPAASFFARGVDLLPTPARSIVLGVSVCAALVSALVFTSGLVYPAPEPMWLSGWLRYAKQLPHAYVLEVIQRLVVADW